MNVLYICTHNRCRSILSEAITNQLGGGRLHAASAGSQPVAAVHPLTLKYLQECEYGIDNLQSQSWSDERLAKPDLVITVCDSAAHEPCPVWLGDAVTVHWGLTDPSKVTGSQEQVRDSFLSVIDQIERRVALMLTSSIDQYRGQALESGMKCLMNGV